MKRLLEEEGEAQNAVRAAAAWEPAWPEPSRLRMRAALVRGSRPQRYELRWLVVPLAIGLVLTVASVLQLRPDSRPVPEEVAVRELPAGTALEVRGEQRLRSAHFEQILTHGLVAVEVTSMATVLRVIDGSVTARRSAREVCVGAGQVLSSTDERFADEPPSSLLEQQRRLALAMAAFDGQRFAEAALAAQALLEQFPQGLLAPEAHLVRFRALVALQARAAAIDEGRWYVQHQPAAPASAQIAQWLRENAP